MPTVIDSNCMIGPTTVSASRSVFTKDSLKELMDVAAIERGMVFYSLSKENDPAAGNAELMGLLADEPRIDPVWVLLPPDTGEMGSAEDLICSMIDQGVRLARIFPKDHNFSLTEWGCGALLSALEEHRVPLMIDLSQTSYDEVNAVCKAHPGLPLLLSDVAYRSDRYLYPLLRIHGNLRLETSRYQTHRGIESICGRFSAKRLIFGSRTPDLAPGPIAMTVRYAKISQPEKDMILGGNMENLMREVCA